MNTGSIYYTDDNSGLANAANFVGSTDRVYSIDVFGATASIPEPSTLIIWSLLGGLGIAFGYWRRRKAA